MATIAINDYIAARGISGSSRSANLIANALADSHMIRHLTPNGLARTKIARAVEMVKWDYWDSPSKAVALDADVIVHCTNIGLPRGEMKSIIVVHDVMALDHPDLFSRNYVRYLRAVMPLSVKSASTIVCPSVHSKNRIIARWPEARVITIPWTFPDAHLADIPRGRNGKNHNVLVVSSVDKHKRLDLAVAAVSVARRITGVDFTLTVVGRPGNAELELAGAIAKYDSNSNWATRVSGINDTELNDLYSTSFCLLVSSLDEGFCLPIVEGGIRGLPAVHTGRGPLNEVAAAKVRAPTVPRDDVIILAEQIIGLLDDMKWKSASRSEMESSVKNSWSDFVENWRSVVSEVNE